MKIKWSLDINTGAVERSEAARARRLAGATVVGMMSLLASTGYMKKQPCRSKFVMATFLSLAVRGFAWLSVVVKQRLTTLVPRKMVKADWEDNFGQLLMIVEPGFEGKVVDKILI